MQTDIFVSVIVENGSKILLGHMPPGVGPYPNAWHLPGLGLKADGTLLMETVAAYVKKQTGIDIQGLQRVMFDEDLEPNNDGDLVHFVILVFTAKGSGVPKAGGEFTQAAWVERSELAKTEIPRSIIKVLQELKIMQ